MQRFRPTGRTGSPRPREGGGGLKAGAIGYASNLIISVASVAPAYSLASILGFVVAVEGMGVHAPAVMIVSFVPMLLIAAAYYYMNRADPDCGTSFTWVTRSMGPHLGWLTGWAIIACDVIVMATLAYIAGVYTFLLFGLDAAASNTLDVSIIAAIWIIAMTWICVIGIELNAATQKFLLMIEVFTLAAFSIVALLKVYGVIGTVPANSMHVAGDWFSPFGLPGGSTALINGVLLGVFIYWGWDSGVCVNEESDDPTSGPGKAAVVSTFLLLGDLRRRRGRGAGLPRHRASSTNNSDDVLKALATDVFPSPFDKLLIITVLTSASASTQTTILPTARTALSMARIGSIPKIFGRIHPALPDPGRGDPRDGRDLARLDPLHHQRQPERARRRDHRDRLPDRLLLRADRLRLHDLLPQGADEELPQLLHGRGGADARRADARLHLRQGLLRLQHDLDRSELHRRACSGIGTPILIGVGGLVLGVVVLVFANFAYRPFFRRKPEVAQPGILEGEVTGEATVMADT